jgi:CelD/BcsL family acetyltransferase involved in cellulose biosynthesis
MTIDVGTLSAADEPAYRDLVGADRRALVYATLEYRDFLARAVGGEPTTLVARRGGDLAGALPFFERSSPELGSVVNSLPWYGSHGGCTLAPGEGDGVRRALLEAFRERAERPGVVSATTILTPAETAHAALYAESLAPRATDRRVGQVTGLPAPGEAAEEELAATLRQKTRNLVRKALRQGFVERVTDEDRDWDYLVATHATNMAAMRGKAKPRAHFDALRAALPRDWLRLSVAELDGRPVAALLLVRFNRTVEYLTPVIEHDFRPRQPLSFLIWHAMLDAVASGYRWWNWGGTWSSQDSLHHFKAGWGARDLEYVYLVQARPAAVDVLRAARDRAADAFPYYYVYPYAQLADDAA